MTYVKDFVSLIPVPSGKVQHSVHHKTVWQYSLCFESHQLSPQIGNCNAMLSDGSDSSRLGMMSSARMKVDSLLGLCFAATKSVKKELFLFLNTRYITNICFYTTDKILVITLLKLSIFKEKGELKNLE